MKMLRERALKAYRRRGLNSIMFGIALAAPCIYLGGVIAYAVGYSLVAAAVVVSPKIAKQTEAIASVVETRHPKGWKWAGIALNTVACAGFGLAVAALVVGTLGAGVLALGMGCLFLPIGLRNLREQGARVSQMDLRSQSGDREQQLLHEKGELEGAVATQEDVLSRLQQRERELLSERAALVAQIAARKEHPSPAPTAGSATEQSDPPPASIISIRSARRGGGFRQPDPRHRRSVGPQDRQRSLREAESGGLSGV